jgi:hypothetical protein
VIDESADVYKKEVKIMKIQTTETIGIIGIVLLLVAGSCTYPI